jgi:peptidoglycan/LPS O-acetylase OafA/YrhL
MLRLPSFRRITSGGRYLAEVDGLRFVAIAAVLIFHTWMMATIHMGDPAAPHSAIGALLLRMLLNGKWGVPLFFCISGFILGLPFAKAYLAGGERIRLKAYLLRRVTRLEPPYIASLLIRTVPVMLALHLSFRAILPHLLASMVYLHLILFQAEPLVQRVAWSLEIEIQFYLLVPLLAPLLYQRNAVLRRTVFLLLLPGLGLAQSFFPPDVFLLHYTILNWAQFFIAGLFVADLYTTDFARIPASWLWDISGLLLWPLFFWFDDFGVHVFGPLVLVAQFLGAFKGHLLRKFYQAAPISLLGGMCYSLYLTHSLILQGLAWAYYKAAGTAGHFYARWLVSEFLFLPVLAFFGAIYFLLLERPCMDKRWPQKLMAWLRAKSPWTQRELAPVQDSVRDATE